MKTKIINIYPIKCPICNAEFEGKSPKDADKQLNQHYLFKHTGLSLKCINCNHYKSEHEEKSGCKKCYCKGFKENGK